MNMNELPPNDDYWEPLGGKAPEVVLDRHPDGRSMVLGTVSGRSHRAAIWDNQTGKLVWDPGDLNALCWVADGTEMLGIREIYRPQPHLHTRIASPLQSEYTQSIVRYTWPDGKPFASAPLKLPTGWVTGLAVSPTAPIAYVAWQEQGEAGVELVSWEYDDLRQVPGEGHQGSEFMVEGPHFTPDGRYLVIVYGQSFWWFGDEADEDADPYSDEGIPSTCGEFSIGTMVVRNNRRGTFREVDLSVTLPAGWQPDDPDEASYQAISSMGFSREEAFFSLWNGETIYVPFEANGWDQ